ncbi:hypothetical protein QYF36_010706 [Acer negundo]|nr:hypothetical protein QYF36_010706 [Acer negundo]
MAGESRTSSLSFSNSVLLFRPFCILKHLKKAPKVNPPLAWSPPPTGELKLNSDVSVKKGFNHIGVRGVIRNDSGQLVVAMTKAVLGIFYAELGELLALREGDSFQWSDAGPIVIDIKGLFEDFRVVKCLATPKNGNVMAHILATLAFSSMEDRV